MSERQLDFNLILHNNTGIYKFNTTTLTILLTENNDKMTHSLPENNISSTLLSIVSSLPTRQNKSNAKWSKC